MTQPATQPDWIRLYPRFLHFGVAYGDLQQIGEGANDWPSFSARMEKIASERESLGDTALANGRKQSANEYFHQATIYFHFSQIRLTDWNQRGELQGACRRTYRKLSSLLEPPIIPVGIPFQGHTLPGYIREAGRNAPWVVLIGGLDSEKEVELHQFAEGFLRRGCSVCYFDGPGQGELHGQVSMRKDFEGAVSTLIDFLISRFTGEQTKFGCFGVSFGGHMACRAAAADSRISACISLGGFFDGSIFPKFPPLAADTLRRTFCLAPGADIAPLAPEVTLEPWRGHMTAPLFIVHGKEDHLVGLEQVQAMRDWARGPVEVWVMEGAEHVCTNRFHECLPRLGDWMAENLMVSREERFALAMV
jgi:pimeloyl-ACP methyl ester carboxylesterase